MREYILAVLSAALTVSLSMILLPEGSVKKYARLASSVIISLTIISPFVTFIKNSEPPDIGIEASDIMTGEEAEQKYADIIKNEYAENIERELSIYGRINATVNTAARVTLIEIYTDKPISESTLSEIKNKYAPEALEVHYD